MHRFYCTNRVGDRLSFGLSGSTCRRRRPRQCFYVVATIARQQHQLRLVFVVLHTAYARIFTLCIPNRLSFNHCFGKLKKLLTLVNRMSVRPTSYKPVAGQ